VEERHTLDVEDVAIMPIMCGRRDVPIAVLVQAQNGESIPGKR